MATSRIATQPRVSRSPKSAEIPDNIDPNDPMLAKARAFAETIRQLESGRTLKNPVKLPVFNKEGTDFLPDAFPVRPKRAKPPERRKPSHRRLSDAPAPPDLARHRRKCVICNHPDRDEIEEQFIHWRRPGDIAYDFDIEETRCIHRHAHAVGLYARRRENYLFTLENLLERGDEIELTAAAYIKAVRAYACMCDTVRWTEPAIRVAHEYHVHSGASPQELNPNTTCAPSSSLLPLARRGGEPAFDQPTPAVGDTHCQGTASAVPLAGVNSRASAPEGNPAVSPSSILSQAAIADAASSANATPCDSGLQPRRNTRLDHVSTSERLEGRGSSSTSPRASSRSCALEEKSVPAPSSLLPQAALDQPAPASSAPSAPLVGATLGSPAPATQAASEDSAPSALQGSSNKSPKPDNDPRATGRVPSPAPGIEPPASSPNRPSPRLETELTDTKQRKEVLSNRP